MKFKSKCNHLLETYPVVPPFVLHDSWSEAAGWVETSTGVRNLEQECIIKHIVKKNIYMVFFVAPGCVKRRRGDHDTRNGLTGSKTKTNPTVLYLLKLQSKLHHHYNMYTKDRVIYTTLDSGISSVWHYTPKNVKNSTCQETCPRFCFTFRSPSAENSIRIHVKVHITDAWYQIGKLEKFTFEWETSIYVHFFLFAKDVLYLGAKEVSSSSNHLDHDQGIITYHTWLVYCTECIVKNN